MTVPAVRACRHFRAEHRYLGMDIPRHRRVGECVIHPMPRDGAGTYHRAIAATLDSLEV